MSEEACPGCGLVLPGAGPPSGRINASAACIAVHDRIAAFEARFASLARYRQLRVDTYGPPIPASRRRRSHGPVVALAGRLFTGRETFWRATDTYLQVADGS